MDAKQITSEFLDFVREIFPAVKSNGEPLKHVVCRNKIFIPTIKKEWIMVDENKNYVHIAINHSKSEFTETDIKNANFRYGRNGRNMGANLNANKDAIEISIFPHEPFNFRNEAFTLLLKAT